MTIKSNSIRLKLAMARAVLLATSSDLARMAEFCNVPSDGDANAALIELFVGCLALRESAALFHSIFGATFANVSNAADSLSNIPRFDGDLKRYARQLQRWAAPFTSHSAAGTAESIKIVH